MMTSEDGVSATVWVEKSGGKYDGVMVGSHGCVTELGKTLVQKYPTRQSAEALVAGGSLMWIDESGGRQPWDGETLVFQDAGKSVMRMTAKRYLGGAYVYVMTLDGKWMFGLDMGHPVGELL